MHEQKQKAQNAELQQKSFQACFPAVQVSSKNHSLEADIATGWRPKMKVIGPVPLNFDSNIIDQLIQELTSFGRKYKQRAIYLGYRYASSFNIQKEIKKKYQYKYDNIINQNFTHLAAYFRKFHHNFKAKQIRLFKGMNPTIKTGDQLIFDSNFQSGNLDAVIKVGEFQYDLFMRVDTNTRGHIQWFNFTIKNVGKRKVKLNLVNFRKTKTLYQRDMKPYILSSYLQQNKGVSWQQGGYNVQYIKSKLRYTFLQDVFDQEVLKYYSLKFEYFFLSDNEQVQFAYCPPFTYSENMRMIIDLQQSLKEKMQKQQEQIHKIIMNEDILCESLGGLDIPLLTITDESINESKKKCVLISARIHPGQSCGSYMVKGFLKYLCGNSQGAKYLLKNIVFKVIPMINPDGVTVGNFRTSFCGCDLNRTFKNQSYTLIPEVQALKKLVLELKNQFKNRLIFFMDFHGHSVKKNVFLYGSQYDIWQNNYYKTRIFPKIIASQTEIFRYYSCNFRIEDGKKTTARAVILKNIPHCYTIQASTSCYYSPQSRSQKCFTPDLWSQMGGLIAQSLKQYYQLLEDAEANKGDRKFKISKFKNKCLNMRTKPISTVWNDQMSKYNHVAIYKYNKIKPFKQDQSSFKKAKNKFSTHSDVFSEKMKQIIEQIKNDQVQRQQQKLLFNEHSSDNFSSNGSDSQGTEDDLSKQQLIELHGQIKNAINQFKDLFYLKNNSGNKIDIHQSFKSKSDRKKQLKESVDLFSAKGIQMIPSLRKKSKLEVKNNDKQYRWPKIKSQVINSKVEEQKCQVAQKIPNIYRLDKNLKHASNLNNKDKQFNFKVSVSNIDFASVIRNKRPYCQSNFERCIKE